MTATSYLLLGLLAAAPRHGYDLKRAHDQQLPRARPVAYGQVYATLGRLERDGLVAPAGQDRDGGPDRTSYRVTEAGLRALDDWLGTVEPPAPYLGGALFTKVMVALFVSGVPRATAYLAAQRAAHVARLRELTAVKADPAATVGEVIAADLAINHLDADLRWLATTRDRVADLHREMSR